MSGGEIWFLKKCPFFLQLALVGVLLSPATYLVVATLQSQSKDWRPLYYRCITNLKYTFVVSIKFWPQAHGDRDEVVSYKRGQLTAEVVERLVKKHKMITYPGMGHEGTLVSRDQQDVDYLPYSSTSFSFPGGVGGYQGVYPG